MGRHGLSSMLSKLSLSALVGLPFLECQQFAGEEEDLRAAASQWELLGCTSPVSVALPGG